LRIFCGFAAKNRAIRGYGFASGPGAVRRGRFAPLQSLSLPKKDIRSCLGLGISLRENPREWNQPASCRPKATASVPFLGMGFLRSKKPMEITRSVLSAIHAVFRPSGRS
jgi:hypothetical protein